LADKIEQLGSPKKVPRRMATLRGARGFARRRGSILNQRVKQKFKFIDDCNEVLVGRQKAAARHAFGGGGGGGDGSSSSSAAHYRHEQIGHALVHRHLRSGSSHARRRRCSCALTPDEIDSIPRTMFHELRQLYDMRNLTANAGQEHDERLYT
jgi:hypothetical protein